MYADSAFASLARKIHKVQNAVLQPLAIGATASSLGAAVTAACVVVGTLYVCVYGLVIVIQLKYLGLLIWCCCMSLCVAMVFWTGCIENQAKIRVVPMKKVELTLRGRELVKLQESELATLRLCKGDALEAFCDRNRRIARAFGPGSIGRASPTRAVPVLVDFERPGERFWAIENSPAVRYSLQSYTEIRIRLVRPRAACPHIADATSRWQALRVRAAQCKFKEVAKRLRGFEMIFEYPRACDDGLSSKLQVRFRCAQASAPPRRGTLGTAPSETTFMINEMEGCFDAWLEDCCQAEAKRRALSRERSCAGCPGQSGGAPGGAPGCAAPPQREGQREQERAASPRCRRGHPMRRYRKKISGVCDSCRAKIPKGEWAMVCIYSPSCSWFMCQRCAPTTPTSDDFGLCVCCLESNAEMVMQGCGHLVFCAQCGRSVVAMALGAPAKSLKKEICARTPVACPVCRQESGMVDRHDYRDVIYTP